MKRIIIYGLFAGVLLSACSKSDDSVAVVADFTIFVSGQAPDAMIVVLNNSTGAATYEWTFGVGADVATSTIKDPAVFWVDKAGSFVVKLKATNGGDSKEISKNVTVEGHSAIVAFDNVGFGLNAGDALYGRFFSFATGKVYLDNEINATVGPTINLAFGSQSHVMYYFQSPTVPVYNVTGATVTKVSNYMTTNPISATDFDSMNDDSKLAGLTIDDTNESFGNSSIPGGMILFEISDGRKGVIKTVSINNNRILVDIKIQKY